MINQYSVIIFVLEMIGTIAFASSGAMVGIRKNMDIFGVSVLGVTTAVGGGCIRDLILGIHPPKMFQNFAYVGMAIVTSLLIFFAMYIKRELLEGHFIENYEQVMNAFDAIGLGIFTVVGIQTTLTIFDDSNTFLLIFVGVITSVGGGMLRDVLTGTVPFVFVKHIYASASLVGAILYVILRCRINDVVAMLISMITVICIRILAAKYRWNLPRIHNSIQEEKRQL